MSYEGYVRLLCKAGHLESIDVSVWFDEDEWECPICGEGVAWMNCVNVTNGSYDDDGNRIDGHVELECIEENFCTCPDCGIQHRSAAPVYKIPEKVEVTE